VTTRDLFDFLRLTGLRADELCWLTKAHLDAARPHVKVRAKDCPAGSGRAWRPKHGHERVVPLCPEALAVATRAASASPAPWLFHAPGTQGKQPGRWRKSRLWKAVKAAMRAGGVARGTTHTFRHVFCSFLARRGVSPFAIMKVMGHDSLEIVLQYCHTTDQELLDAIRAVPFGEMLGAATAAAAAANGATTTATANAATASAGSATTAAAATPTPGSATSPSDGVSSRGGTGGGEKSAESWRSRKSARNHQGVKNHARQQLTDGRHCGKRRTHGACSVGFPLTGFTVK
jgi:hypothetical protein